MSKLISNPSECGYFGIIGHKCKNIDHPQRRNNLGRVLLTLPCCNIDKFPTNCPLPNGMTKEQFKEKQKPNIVHVESCGKTRKRVYSRRNRKNCTHWINGTMSTNRCSEEDFRKPGSIVYPICIGVTCGRFKTK